MATSPCAISTEKMLDAHSCNTRRLFGHPFIVGFHWRQVMSKIASIVLSILLVGCATPYQPVGMTGGYEATQLDENVFSVSFRGNGYSSRERATNFTMLRSAETALEHGYQYFVIIDSERTTSQSTYTTPATTYGSATAYGNTAYGRSTTYGGQTYNISKPRSAQTILCFKEKPEGFAYNAAFMKKSLREKYRIPETITPPSSSAE